MNYFSTLVPGLAILCTLLSSPPSRAQSTTPSQEGTLSYRDARLAKKPPTRAWRVYSAREVNPRYDYGPIRDPRYNQAYPLRLQVACTSEGDDARSGRRFVIHYLKPEDEPLARRVGVVMAHLYWIGVDYLGKGWSGSRYANVWLARNGTAGGEEFEGHLYLFAILEPRAPAEWVRELAHEYSHTHLPRVGEYTQPEKWANGYLGERLFLKWLLTDNGLTDVWGERIDGAAYVANGVAPLRERVCRAGPSSPAGRRRDAAGMEHFIGKVLALEAAHGPALVASVLDRFAEPRPENLERHLESVIDSMGGTPLRLNPEAFVRGDAQVETLASPAAGVRFRKASYCVYLPAGEWQIRVAGAIPAGTVLSLDGVALVRPAPGQGATAAWERPAGAAQSGWRRMEFVAQPGSVLQLDEILISRKGTPATEH